MDLTNKFVAVLNKKNPPGVIMNALAHMAAGLVGCYPNIAEMKFDSYIDKDGNDHKSISDHPFIILSADNSNKVRGFRENCIESGIHFVDFTSTMTVGTYLEQQERTKTTPETELEYYGVCAFGNAIQLGNLTRKFSLWR